MLKEGVILGKRYEILGRVGSGGMADVYKSKDHKLNRFVAVKVLKSDYRNDEVFIQKFVSEAQAAAGLMHPNVVNVYDVGQDRGLYYMVMELVEGITLKDYIEKKGQLSAKETISISIQMVSGIQAAHNQHIIHRDIKPQNIIISRDGKVKVTDFGIARATTSTNTISTNVMGSVHYTSPEQARGGIVGVQSDIYSAGITMYEMITGHVPFDGDSTVSVAIKHLREEIIAPSEEVPDIPYSLECIILKCTQKNVAKRYQNCAELLADLKHSLVAPNGDFVNGPMYGARTRADETVVMSQEELNRVQKRRYADDDYDYDYDNDDDDDYDNDDFDYDNDDDDDDDYGYGACYGADRSRNRKPDDRRRKNNVDPNTKKIMKILMAAAAVIIAIVIVVMIGNAAGLFKGFGPGISTTSEDVKVTVPDLIGMTEDEAKDALAKKHLGYYVIDRKTSDQFEEGEIMEQEIEANKKVKKNTQINVVVSMGKEIKDVKVPDVVGMKEEKAQKLLEKSKFVVSSEAKYDDHVEAGKVISTDPVAGTEMKEGGKVTMYVSLGVEKIELPQVVGMSLEEAQATLEAAGLEVGSVKEEYDDSAMEGIVTAQDPSKHGKVKKGTKVNLTVSKGPKVKMVSVPSLNNMTEDVARQTLIAAGLDVVFQYEMNTDVTYGYVISQSTPAGNKVPEGTTITVVISYKQTSPVEPGGGEDTGVE